MLPASFAAEKTSLACFLRVLRLENADYQIGAAEAFDLFHRRLRDRVQLHLRPPPSAV